MAGGTWHVAQSFKVLLLALIIRLAVDFFNHLNMLYGTVTEFCTAQEVCLSTQIIERCQLTPTECPIMSSGPRFVFTSIFIL